MIIELSNCRTPACVETDATKHRWEWTLPTIQELRRIQKTTGMGPIEWEQALQDLANPSAETIDATIVLVQILHSRIGMPVAFEEVDFYTSDLAFYADPTAEPEGKGETQTSPLPGDDPSSTSGAPSEEASTHKSSPTPATSGGGSDSPS